MHDPDFQPPVNPMPPAVVVLFLAIACMEAALYLAEARIIGGPGAVGWRLGLIRDYGFSGQVADWMISNGRVPAEHVLRTVTYPFLHFNFTHALFAMVLLLALGKLVAERLGQVAFLAIFFIASAGAAWGYALLLNDPNWLVGAYPGVYGLIGGYSYVMWRKLAGTGTQQYRAFTLIALLMAIQLIWGIFFEVGTQWVAELMGFFIGFGLCFVLAPGEWARLRDRMRQR
ncbi:MAG: rhomboid family intramembrane serine protease [Pseudomonadota bacterium]